MLGGPSFSPRTLDRLELPADGAVEVVAVAPKTLFVPQPLCAERSGAAFLAAAGMEADADERVVAVAGRSGEAGVAALAEQGVRVLEERLGARLRFTLPLLEAEAQRASVWLHAAAQLLYVRIWNERLRYMEVLPLQSQADLLFVVSELDREFGLKAYRIVCSGEGAKEACKRLGSYFRGVVCG